jgi:hypothetical protein
LPWAFPLLLLSLIIQAGRPEFGIGLPEAMGPKVLPFAPRLRSSDRTPGELHCHVGRCRAV